MDELVKRLREDAPTALANCDFDFVEGWIKEAADAIEELQKEVEKEQAFAKCWEEMATDCKDRFQKLLDTYPKWIPVKERLPDQNSGNLYICLIVGGEYDQLSWYELCDFAEGQFWIRDQLYGGHVTHWMPIPRPSKEESNGV